MMASFCSPFAATAACDCRDGKFFGLFSNHSHEIFKKTRSLALLGIYLKDLYEFPSSPSFPLLLSQLTAHKNISSHCFVCEKGKDPFSARLGIFHFNLKFLLNKFKDSNPRRLPHLIQIEIFLSRHKSLTCFKGLH
jgi:hypothetical protein